jgi:serine/threonine protein kinase
MTVSPLRAGDPQRLGGYRLLARLGEGGMGSVFLGESPAGRQVAVKVVRPELSSDPAFRARFHSEVERARQVPPFCTAEVLDADADHDPPYMVVEYVAGPNLADIVAERGPLSGGDLHSVAIGVTVALVAIHDAGVVHRDLKPPNVLFALGAPKVIDFGVAKALDATEHQTEPGQVFGTVAYMGPERILGPATEQADTAGDIFAWGAVVTYAATGSVPYAPETLIAAATGTPLPPPDLAGLAGPLRNLVRRALDEDPRRRPSAHELLDQLVRAGAPSGPLTRGTRPALQRAASAVRNTAPLIIPPSTLAVRPARPRRRRVLAAAAAVLMAGGAFYPVLRLVSPGDATSAQPDLAGRASSDDKASRAGRADRCTLDGPLDVTPGRSPDFTPGRSPDFTCPASRTGGDQVIRARLALTTASACAAIRIHVTDSGAYRISVCPDRVTLDVEQGDRARPIAMSTIDPPTGATAWHQLEIHTNGPSLTVALDGENVIDRPHLAPPTRGAVTLGSVRALGGPPSPAPAIFTDVVIASTP